MNRAFRVAGIMVVATVLMLLLSIDLQAAQPYTPQVVNPLTESWRWKQFPELEGTGIRCIAETDDERVWVGCNRGVLEYNGYDWITHQLEGGETAMPVEEIMVTDDELIYAATAQGIYRYDGEDWERSFVVPEGNTFQFYRLEQLSEGRILACTNFGFTVFGAEGEIDFFTSQAGYNTLHDKVEATNWVILPADALDDEGSFYYASDVLEEAGGEVWFAISLATEEGKLLKFNWSAVKNGKITDYEVMSSNASFTLGEGQQLLRASDGKLWVINSTSNKGILVFDGEHWQTINISERFGGDEYMTDIVQSPNGAIWISSMAKIFTYTPDGKWNMYKAPRYPIPANRVILQNSRNDQIWVAGYKSKVLLIDCSLNQWLTYEGLSFQAEVSPNEQWFLEKDNRIVRRMGSEWTAYGVADGAMDAPVRIFHTSRGQIWAAGSHRGIAATARWDGERWEMQQHPRLSWGIDYRAVFEADDGTLWFGGGVDAQEINGFKSGLLELKDPTARQLNWKHHMSGENGLGQSNVYGIAQSEDGRIWIGGSSLRYYDGTSWKIPDDERLQQYINYVHSTDDLLLVGSRYYGVFVYDGENWKNYNTSDGLSGNTILSIDALSDSTYIVATENDICRFDGTSWATNIFPEELNIDFEGGTVHHTDSHLWVNHVPRSWKRRAYQGGIEGIEEYAFFTVRYQPSHTPPETTVDFYLKSVPADGNGLISWQGKDYFGKTTAGQLMYSYRMNGGPWSPFSVRDRHSFKNLPGGSHTLDVRARDLDFNIDPTPASVNFKVLLPIWKQSWFIALMLTFLTIFGIYEYRVLSKKRKLEVVNVSLQTANEELKDKSRHIERQNREIVSHRDRILEQSAVVESKNLDLQERNEEIREQRDRLEEMLVQVENLSKVKLGFFTNISHELRTPLTLIQGPVAHLKNDAGDMPITQRRQLLDMVQRNAARLLKLIDQLLEIRRIEQSALEIKLSDLRLSEYIGEIVSLFDHLAERRGMCLSFNDESEGKLAAVDSDKVEKIVANLLSNAFRHTPEGGCISVGLRTVPAHEYGLNCFYDRYFEIAVRDTGTGMCQEKIELIFDKYFTTASDVVDERGVGIGLSYIKDLVYLLQGDIRVESKVGTGSVFRVYLPFVPVKHNQEMEEASFLPELKVTRRETSLLLNSYLQEEAEQVEEDSTENTVSEILVVEDNPDMLHFLKSILKENYSVTTAVNGREALQLARNQTFDLIVSDVMMPEMDGITFCERIKENLVTSHIPVILLTAKAMDESKLSGYSSGADDYITKPFNPDILLARVENLLRQREQLREAFNREFMLTPKTETLLSPDDEFMNRLVTLMHENVSESEFNVGAMCDAMHLSHMHFIRKVKQLTGKKPIDLLKSFRMKKAKDLLAQRSCTVAEVAYKVGFDLPNSFSRTFKKEFDMTPTQYANSLTEEERERESVMDV